MSSCFYAFIYTPSFLMCLYHNAVNAFDKQSCKYISNPFDLSEVDFADTSSKTKVWAKWTVYIDEEVGNVTWQENYFKQVVTKKLKTFKNVQCS